MKQEIRLVITQACNFNCYFCHHEGINELKHTLLTPYDIQYIYEASNKFLGFETLTITGGEPLLVKNLLEITKKLFESGCKTTIVTNGSLLDKNLKIGEYIAKLNVSLHSLNQQVYEKTIGKSNQFDLVISNIKSFRSLYPNVEVNINYALTKKENLVDELDAIIQFAIENEVNIKFIELFPKDVENFIPLEFLHNYLIDSGFYNAELDSRKDKFIKDSKCVVFTTKCLCSRAMDCEKPSDFCNKNNDLFLSQDGIINLCRVKDNSISILDDVKRRNILNLQKKLKKSLDDLGKDCACDIIL